MDVNRSKILATFDKYAPQMKWLVRANNSPFNGKVEAKK